MGGGQVLGGGVIVLVAVLLWLVYLLPTWHHRRQYDAAERNAVRLSQALRVLAETSEVPDEVRVELNTRTALAQQRLARRALAEREGLARRTQAEHEHARTEVARRELAAARALPDVRRARVRRRVRRVLTAIVLLATGLIAGGVWAVAATGSSLVLWAGVTLALGAGALRRRMTVIDARAGATATPPTEAGRQATALQDVGLEDEGRGWAPRSLPRPLTASAGSRAAAEIAVAEAQDARRQAAVEEAMRRRAQERAPLSLDGARRARSEADEFAGSGEAADDAAIEAHVRRLLARRAAGE